MALCWTGFVMLFFSFSTTQEYYSMPIYPALALLIGSAMAEGGSWVRGGTRLAAVLAGIGAVVAVAVLIAVRSLPTSGDVQAALEQHPEAYTLSLGHLQDFTLRSFAYFREPLLVAALALLLGAVGAWCFSDARAFFALALMMMVFSQATRMALVVLEPTMSSRALAEAMNQSPPGEMIVGDEYYSFSSVFFYTHRRGLLTNRVNNLEYGSNAPGAPKAFLSPPELKARWQSPQRAYLLAAQSALPRFRELLGADGMYLVKESGGKFLFCNQTLDRP